MSSCILARRRTTTARTKFVATAVIAVGALFLTSCAPSEPPAASTATMIPAPVPTTGPSGSPTTPAPAPVQQVPLADPVTFDSGVTVSILSATAGTVTAETPGEMSGAAVIVRVRAENASSTAINLGSAVVTVAAADGVYAVPSYSEPFSPFAGDIAPGDSAEAVYVFLLDDAADREIEVTVNYAAGAPVAVFTGTTSTEGESE